MNRSIVAGVSYELQTFKSRNPLVRYAHQSRAKRSLNLILKHLPSNGSLLDFGAGEGHIISLVHQRRPKTDLYAIELKELPQPFVKQVDSLNSIGRGTLDIVSSFEVCEHLYESEVEQFISDAHLAIKPTGKLIISVPIMYGLSLAPKELNKMLMYRRKADYSLIELSNALLGRSIQRPENPRHTHKGFDFRALQQKIEQRFAVEQRLLSPFPLLPWGLNSQCFWVCEPKA